MASINHNPLSLLGAYVRGEYVISQDDFRLTFSFDGIVELVVVNLDPSQPPEFFVAGDFHTVEKCTTFEVVKPAPASRVSPISAVRTH